MSRTRLISGLNRRAVLLPALGLCLSVGIWARSDDRHLSSTTGPAFVPPEESIPVQRPAPGEPSVPDQPESPLLPEVPTPATEDRPPLVIPPPYRPNVPPPADPVIQPGNPPAEPEPESTRRLRPSDELVPRQSLTAPAENESFLQMDPRFGLVVIVRESFANQFVEREDRDAGPVRDFILGAQVHGEHTTIARTRLDFLPSPNTALMQIRLTGTVCNRTVGVTPQAHVHSLGEHAFRLEKEVNFDGIRFYTRTPAAWVSPRICNQAAYTPLHNVPLIGEPLLGPVSSYIALSTAEQRRREAERITAYRVTTPAARAFNEQADSQLAVLNQTLERFQRTREELRITPEEELIHSTDELVQYKARYATAIPRLPLPADYRRIPPDGLELLVSDALINAVADDLPLGGAEFSVREVEQFIEQFLELIPGFVPSELPPNPLIDQDLLTVRLSQFDPAQVTFLEEETHLTFRMSFIPLEGPEVPTKLVTIVYRASIDEEWVILTPDDVRIAAAPDAPDPLGLLTENFIRQQITERLLPLRFRNGSTITLPDAPSVKITLTALTSRDGWLKVTFR